MFKISTVNFSVASERNSQRKCHGAAATWVFQYSEQLRLPVVKREANQSIGLLSVQYNRPQAIYCNEAVAEDADCFTFNWIKNKETNKTAIDVIIIMG